MSVGNSTPSKMPPVDETAAQYEDSSFDHQHPMLPFSSSELAQVPVHLTTSLGYKYQATNDELSIFDSEKAQLPQASLMDLNEVISMEVNTHLYIYY
jgi:hypothetical protein